VTKPHICLDDCVTTCRFGEFAFGMRRTEIAMRIGISLERCYPDYVAYGNVALDTGIKWDALSTVFIALPFHDLAGLARLESWKAEFDSRFSWDFGRIVPGMTPADVRAAFSEVAFEEPQCIPGYPRYATLCLGDCMLEFECPANHTEPTLRHIVLFRPATTLPRP
jgi:hypothetical protein